MRLDPRIQKIAKDIKEIKIQGARNVAKAVVKALIYYTENSRAKDVSEFYEEFLRIAKYMHKIRPTEPMTKNVISRILNYARLIISKRGNEKNLENIKRILARKEKELINQIEINRQKIAEYGSSIIQDERCIMTYCHSSTVTTILKRAWDEGKKIRVIACETRPLFQGRITATELAKKGIPTTLIVDGAMGTFIKDVDLIMVGGDAITSKGDLINKIGTSTLAHIAYARDVPMYSAVELFKYDPLTLFGIREEIEERDSKEVWDKRMKHLTIRNPAFDRTPAKYISAYITEAGIIPPQSLVSIVKSMYDIYPYNGNINNEGKKK